MNRISEPRSLRGLRWAVGIALATAVPAFAQTPPAATADNSENTPVVQEVIVTGSRIPQPNLIRTSPTRWWGSHPNPAPDLDQDPPGPGGSRRSGRAAPRPCRARMRSPASSTSS